METISPAPHPLIHDDDDDDDDGWCPYYGRLLYEIDLFSVVNKKYDDDDDVVMCLCYPLGLLFLICCILTHSAWGALRFKDFSAPHPLIHGDDDDGWCPYYGRLLYEIDLFSIVNEEVWWWWCCYVLVLCTWSSIFNMLHINSLCMRCVTFQGFFCPPSTHPWWWWWWMMPILWPVALWDWSLFCCEQEVWWGWCCYVLVLCTWSSIFNMLHISS